MKKTNTEIMQEMVNNPEIDFDTMYDQLRDDDIGFWDGINSREIIEGYISEMMTEGIIVSHMLKALEESDADIFQVWLGNSMETPTPIESKQDLMDALN